MRILFCGNGWLPIVDSIAERRPSDSVDIWDRNVPLREAVADVAVILPSNGTIDAGVIAAAKPLILIQQPASGYDCVDVDAARARGVPVCNAPRANPISVAETATYLMLALARNAREAERAFAEQRIGVPLGREITGKTLGLIGYGASAKAFARIASGFVMTVEYVTSRSSAADLDDLLADSDVVSLHCPLNSGTRGMVNEGFIAKMKPGALLINCARGPIIARPALEAALESGHLGGAGLDTYWEEPWDSREPLFKRSNVITLPHVAGSSFESFERITDIVCENIRRVEVGVSPLHRVD